MNYVLIAVAGVVVVALLAAALGKKRGKPTGPDRTRGPGITSTEPAADAPTPGDSVTATPAQERKADRHTPAA